MTTELQSGFHMVDEPSVQTAFIEQARGAGWQVYPIDLAMARNKREALFLLSQTLKFPAYFGNNWDALVDMLRDIAAPSADNQGKLLAMSGLNGLALHDPRSYTTFLDILRTITEDKNPNTKLSPLLIVLQK